MPTLALGKNGAAARAAPRTRSGRPEVSARDAHDGINSPLTRTPYERIPPRVPGGERQRTDKCKFPPDDRGTSERQFGFMVCRALCRARSGGLGCRGSIQACHRRPPTLSNDRLGDLRRERKFLDKITDLCRNTFNSRTFCVNCEGNDCV